MKFKNKYFFITTIFCLLVFSAYSAFKVQHESSKDATNDMWNFELYNKNPQPILFFLKTSEEKLALEKLGSGGKIRLAIDKNFIRNLTLSVWVKSDGAYGLRDALDTPKGDLAENESELIKENPPTTKVRIDNKDAKTVFLTFDQNNQIRPQTGKLKGILGVTDSGLSLRNNIRTTDIKLIKEPK